MLDVNNIGVYINNFDFQAFKFLISLQRKYKRLNDYIFAVDYLFQSLSLSTVYPQNYYNP